MNLKQITTHITTLEGKKREVKVGDVREIVSIVSDLAYANAEVIQTLIANGRRRANKKKASV